MDCSKAILTNAWLYLPLHRVHYSAAMATPGTQHGLMMQQWAPYPAVSMQCKYKCNACMPAWLQKIGTCLCCLTAVVSQHLFPFALLACHAQLMTGAP